MTIRVVNSLNTQHLDFRLTCLPQMLNRSIGRNISENCVTFADAGLARCSIAYR